MGAMVRAMLDQLASGSGFIRVAGAALLLAAVGQAQEPVERAAGPGGWERAFDGESLTGWTTVGGPYDGKALWSVEDGAIVGREGPGRAGGLLYTEEQYSDFEIELDAWITYPFDSGVFARMISGQRGAQVTLDYRPGGEIGGVYSNAWLQHNPAGESAWKRDEWNRVRVWCAGDPMVLRAWVNGVLVTDFRIPEGAGEFAKQGHIGLQVHGGGNAPEDAVVRFRDVRVRRLPEGAGDVFAAGPDGAQAITAAGEALGWRSLFNGKDLCGWTGAGDGQGYRVRDGLLEFLYEGSSPQLMTDADYRDFHLRLDFRTSEMANSGLFLRSARDGGNASYSGCELQILDDFNWEERSQSKLKPYQFTGGLYGARAPDAKDALRPLGEWNTYDVVLRGSRLTAFLNGRLLHDVDTHELECDQGAPFAERVRTGFIGLQRHAPAGKADGDHYAAFRNLFVRELR